MNERAPARISTLTRDDMASHDSSNDPKTADVPRARRPYHAPKLRPLGSVRDVTWGPSPTSLEGTFKGTPKPKM